MKIRFFTAPALAGLEGKSEAREVREEQLFELILSTLWRVPRAPGSFAPASAGARRRARTVPPRLVRRAALGDEGLQVAVQRLLADLAPEAERDRQAVAELLAKPVHERWVMVAEEQRYRCLAVAADLVAEALAAEGRPELPFGEDSESLALLALHLAAGLDPASRGGGNLRDVMAEAWLLLARARLHAGRYPGARHAAVVAQSLAEQGSGDVLLAFRLHLTIAWTRWAGGNRFSVSVHLQAARELAGSARDKFRLGQAWEWIALFLEAQGRPQGAARARRLAARVLGVHAPAVQAEVSRLCRWLRLRPS